VNGRGLRYVRPVLDGHVLSENLIRVLADHGFGVETGPRDELVKRAQSPKMAAFLAPPDFTRLISDAHSLRAILPVGMDIGAMPRAVDAFERNLRRWLGDIYPGNALR
jgi:hypothetical protein